ncbi:TPA: energy-coupling factor transporter ATPase [bacterium]|nr:energy-coupling factor transporter ATPase [bacterium]
MSIVIENLSFVYNEGTPFEVWALKEIDLRIEDGESIGIIGPNGSGKSTLAQHLHGLFKPTKGRVLIGDREPVGIHPGVGFVFQSAEDQFFARTVHEEMQLGYQNFGLSQDQFKDKALEALEMVGLSADIFLRSPHSLSDGEKRRVAVAMTLILGPKTLILDEPTLGLDPLNAKKILEGTKKLNHEKGVTFILISHRMEEILEYCSRVLVMDRGKIIGDGPPQDLFIQEIETLIRLGMEPPWLVRFLTGFKAKGYNIKYKTLNPEEISKGVLEALQG